MKNYTGIVLSGGKSSRMGQEKGLMDFGNIKMIENQLKILEPFCNEILISANSSEYEKFGYRVVKDEHIDIGPLGGLFSAIKASKNDLCIVLSCDIPFINTNIIEELLNHTNSDYSAIVAKYNGRVNPLIAIYDKREVLGKIFIKIQEENYKLMNLLERMKVQIVDFTDREDISEINFSNINTQMDYEKLVKKKPGN